MKMQGWTCAILLLAAAAMAPAAAAKPAKYWVLRLTTNTVPDYRAFKSRAACEAAKKYYLSHVVGLGKKYPGVGAVIAYKPIAKCTDRIPLGYVRPDF